MGDTLLKTSQPSWYSSVGKASVWSHAVRQQHNKSQTQVPPMLVCKYIDWNSSTVMLATRRSTGVTPEVNLRILLHIGNKAYKKGDPPWL